jgi:beta-glucosidase
MNRYENQIAALMSKMTLDQMIGQMVQPERQFVTPEQVKAFHIGSVLSGGGSTPGNNTPQDWIDMNDEYWAASMEADDEHLAIPIIYGVDAIHGNSNVTGAVVFPHNIGLGAARDPQLVEKVARATAREIAATGVEWTFAPTLAVARNDHWGRTFESYSEDPQIVSEYAPYFVRGLQGNMAEADVVACVKHFVGDGATVHGIDQGDAQIDEKELRRLHIPPYIAAIKAGVLTVMASLNSWNGLKCHEHRYLLTDILKDELGFEGFVVSDWDGINCLDDEYAKAVELGVNAGMDMFMITEKWQDFITYTKAHVLAGRIPKKRIEDAVRRILRVKFEFGLFDKPRPSERLLSKQTEVFGSREHRDVAREAVRKSLVLLSENLEGLDADPGQYDVAIVVIGETPYAEMLGDVRVPGLLEKYSNFPNSTTVIDDDEVAEVYATHLYLHEMHPEDIATIKNITAKGIPVVTVMVNGRPLVIENELEASSAFVVAWLPGSEGQGVADVLFGDFDFQGKLSFSWPRYDNENWNVGDEDYNPRFPYGYGLSYQE